MDKLALLHAKAAAFTNIYDTDFAGRKRAGANYVTAMIQLENSSPAEIAAIISTFSDHLDLFLSVAEDPSEPSDVKIRALAYPIAEAFKDLTDSASRQQDMRTVSRLLQDDFLCGVTSIIDFVNDKINIAPLMDRLVRIAENRREEPYLRYEAMLTFDTLSKAARVFGQKIDHDRYNDRFTSVALNTVEPLITKAALEFGVQ